MSTSTSASASRPHSRRATPRSPAHADSSEGPVLCDVPPSSGVLRKYSSKGMQALRNMAPGLLIATAIIAIIAVGYGYRHMASNTLDAAAKKMNDLYTLAQARFEDARDTMSEKQQQIREQFDAAASRTREAQESAKKSLEDMKKYGKDKASEAYARAKETYDSAQKSMAESAKEMHDYWDQWNEDAADAWDRATSGIVRVWERVKVRFSPSEEEVDEKQKQARSLLSNIGSKFSESYENAKRSLQEMKESGKDRTSQAHAKAKSNYEKARMQLEDYLDQIHDFYSAYTDSAKDSISNAMSTAGDYGRSIYEMITCPTCTSSSAIQERLQKKFEEVHRDVGDAMSRMSAAATTMKKEGKKNIHSAAYRKALSEFEESQIRMDEGLQKLEELYDEWSSLIGNAVEKMATTMAGRYEKLQDKLSDQQTGVQREFEKWSRIAKEKAQQVDESLKVLKDENADRGSAAYKRAQARLRKARVELGDAHRKMKEAFDQWVE